MAPQIILIHPPVAKPAEPPAGIASLSSCLQASGVRHQLIDANIEGMIHLMQRHATSADCSGRWDVRACKNVAANLASLQNIGTFGNKSRYSRAVLDLNHVMAMAGKPYDVNLSLADYTDSKLSPLKSEDLLQAAEQPEANPFYSYFSQRLTLALEQSPDFFGFSLNYLSQALCMMAMIGFIKKIHPRQKIIVGGSLVTSWVQMTGRHDLFGGLIDHVVSGAGEQKLLNLLGLAEVRPHPSIDYRLLVSNPYLAPGFILPYSTARGCWWRKCAFCPETAEANPYQPLPGRRVTDELRALSNSTHSSLIHLLDSAVPPALLQYLAEQPPGAPWYGFVRVTPDLTDESFCRALKASGCTMLKLGIESGDQTVLDRLNKGIDLQTASQALITLRKARIATYCYFLFGTPPETEKAALKTLDFVGRHSDCINFLNLAIFNLPAASPEAKTLSTHDFYGGDLSLYKDFEHPSGWQRSNVRHFLEKIFKKHPSIAPIIKRTPELFTSNHAPFFTF